MENKRGEQLNPSSTNKFLLKQNTYKNINQILSLEIIPEKEVYNLIRNFFKSYLDLDYEFTNEELQKELKQVYFSHELKQDTSSLFNSLSQIEYFSKPLSQITLKNLLLNFKDIIDEIVTVHYEKQASFMTKIQHSLHTFLSNHTNSQTKEESVTKINREQEPTIQSNEVQDTHQQEQTPPTPQYEDESNIPQEKIIEEITSQSKIKDILSEVKGLYNIDLGKAKLCYFELLKLYNSLPDSEKEDVFDAIQKVYAELQKRSKK